MRVLRIVNELNSGPPELSRLATVRGPCLRSWKGISGLVLGGSRRPEVQRAAWALRQGPGSEVVSAAEAPRNRNEERSSYFNIPPL